MTNYYLVLIETSGNQNFIFSTNKLKENIGASQLTYQAGTRWILEAIAQTNSSKSLEVWNYSERLRDLLKNSQINPPIEDHKKLVEILIAASGKALLLTKDEATAKQIISEVTKQALIEAPGLDLAGVYVEVENWNSHSSLHQAIKQVHKEYETVRSRRPSPVNRFLRLPIIADCAVSELPASELESLTKAQRRDGKQPKAISLVSSVKRNEASAAIERLQAIAKNHKLEANINKLEETFDDMAWLAIVHADGNGLGQIFLNFEAYIGNDKSNRNYINQYRAFSLALDECTEAAFRLALDVLPKDKDTLPIVPLIVGGDDLTVVCHGEYALEFTRIFLQEFEKQTKVKPEISEIAKEVFGVGKLSACAGIAVVKPHFPFSVAYELAEKLIKSAKNVKRKITKKGDESTPFPCSAIDFHILYDTSGVDLSAIRQKLKPDDKTLLYNRPYIVTIPQENNINSSDSSQEDIGMKWIKPKHWQVLEEWVDLLKKLPSSQTHAMRTALFLGRDAAEAQCKLIENRYESLKEFLETTTLFHEQKIKHDQDPVQSYQVTPFLDALDVMNFLKHDDQTNNQEEE